MKNTMVDKPPLDYVEYKFLFESVSVSDIAEFAYGRALADEDLARSSSEWFKKWARAKIAYQHDISLTQKTLFFINFVAYPANKPLGDGFYFVVEGKWQVFDNPRHWKV